MKNLFFKAMFSAPEQGSTLVSTMVIAGVSVAMMGYVAASQGFQAKAQRISDMKGDREAIQAYIAKGLDCNATIASMNSTCNPNEPIALAANSIDNPILIAKAVNTKKATTYPKLGQYRMLATCEVCESFEGCPKGHKIVIKYSLVNPVVTLPFADLYAPKRLPDCEVPF